VFAAHDITAACQSHSCTRMYIKRWVRCMLRHLAGGSQPGSSLPGLRLYMHVHQTHQTHGAGVLRCKVCCSRAGRSLPNPQLYTQAHCNPWCVLRCLAGGSQPGSSLPGLRLHMHVHQTHQTHSAGVLRCKVCCSRPGGSLPGLRLHMHTHYNPWCVLRWLAGGSRPGGSFTELQWCMHVTAMAVWPPLMVRASA
jgi:hypothetical protein